jgi:hypothetical protein
MLVTSRDMSPDESKQFRLGCSLPPAAWLLCLGAVVGLMWALDLEHDRTVIAVALVGVLLPLIGLSVTAWRVKNREFRKGLLAGAAVTLLLVLVGGVALVLAIARAVSM